MSLYFARRSTYLRQFISIPPKAGLFLVQIWRKPMQGARQGCGFIRIIKGFVELQMLTTTLLSKYVARQEAKRVAKRDLKLPKSTPAKMNETLPKASMYASDAEDGVEEYFEPLTPEQAQTVIVRLRKTASLSSPLRLIMLQLLIGVIAAVVALLVTGEKIVALSVAYGAVAVVVPAGMFAWGVMRRRDSQTAMAAGLRFFIWEAAKVGLTVAMLFAAPALVVDISWLGLLAGFVVTMKVYWLAIWLYPVRNHSV